MKYEYLSGIIAELMKMWPENRALNFVCHGHSVPAGYFATPYVNTLDAYPHQLLEGVKERFPYAVVNVIVTAIGGENAERGAARFERDVLCHRPDLVTIDYALNDTGLGLARAEAAWRGMIEQGLGYGAKLILVTPSFDRRLFSGGEEWAKLERHAEMIRALANEYQIGLADAFAAFGREVREPDDLVNLLAFVNHPNRKGHALIAGEILKYFFNVL